MDVTEKYSPLLYIGNTIYTLSLLIMANDMTDLKTHQNPHTKIIAAKRVRISRTFTLAFFSFPEQLKSFNSGQRSINILMLARAKIVNV
jgi:hypothetical protein